MASDRTIKITLTDNLPGVPDVWIVKWGTKVHMSFANPVEAYAFVGTLMNRALQTEKASRPADDHDRCDVPTQHDRNAGTADADQAVYRGNGDRR